MGNNVPPPVKKSKSKKSKKAAAEWEFDESDYLQKLMGALEQEKDGVTETGKSAEDDWKNEEMIEGIEVESDGSESQGDAEVYIDAGTRGNKVCFDDDADDGAHDEDVLKVEEEEIKSEDDDEKKKKKEEKKEKKKKKEKEEKKKEKEKKKKEDENKENEENEENVAVEEVKEETKEETKEEVKKEKKEKKDKKDKKEKKEKKDEGKEKKKEKKEKKDKDKKEKKVKKDKEEKSLKRPASDDSISDEAAAFRKQHRVSVENAGDDHKTILSFDDGFFSAFQNTVRNFKVPSPIQAEAWPAAIAGRDVVGIAETGSGKTLAFALPGLKKIKNVKCTKGPAMLVISPTRELTMQAHEVIDKAARENGMTSLCIYGGESKRDQAFKIKKKPNIIVCTIGRLLDFVSEGTLSLGNVSYVVLDEADRMLDQGFEPEVRKVMAEIRPTRQTLMFSATWPQSIQKLAHDFLKNPVRVTVGSEDLTANHNVKQEVEMIADGKFKDSIAKAYIKKWAAKNPESRCLLFCLYKKECDRVANNLYNAGFDCEAIHGDRSQQERTAALAKFTKGTVKLLVATDVAARGLDIPNVGLVFNYTFPLTIEDYIHRIGRTGRAGSKGISHTLFTPHDKNHGFELARVLKEANAEIPEALSRMAPAMKRRKPDNTMAAVGSAPTKMTFDDSDEE